MFNLETDIGLFRILALTCVVVGAAHRGPNAVYVTALGLLMLAVSLLWGDEPAQ